MIFTLIFTFCLWGGGRIAILFVNYLINLKWGGVDERKNNKIFTNYTL